MKLVIPILAMAILLIANNSLTAQGSKKQEKQLLTATRKASNMAFANQDISNITQYFTEEITVIAANGSTLSGKEAVALVLETRFKEMPDLIYVRTPKHFKINTAATTAWEEGSWIVKRTQTKDFKNSGGKYSACWKKEEGTWKIQSELFVLLN